MAHVSPEVFQAISRQKARYARYADTKQWDKWEKEIFFPDARFSFFDTDGKPLKVGKQTLAFDSTKALATFFNKFFASVDTLHNICPGDLEQVAPDEVKAVFGFEDQVMAKGLGAWAEIRGGGFYYETWKLVDGQWLIQELRMERTYQKMTFLVWMSLTIASVFNIAL
jgi:hypothetical protein